MKSGWRGVLCWLLALAAPALQAQEAAALDAARPALSQYRIDAWQTEQGLPMDTVQTLLQTRDGTLWIGTGAGLARFDGLRFGTFEASNLPEMARRSVFGLFEDREGGIWIGTSSGAVRYARGRFEQVLARSHTGGRRIWAFAQGPDGAMWMASEAGLLRWQDGALRRWGQAEGLPSERLRSLAWDRDGSLWVGSSGGGLFRFRDGKVSLPAEPSHPEVRHVLADPAGGVWAATAGGGLLHVDASGQQQRWGQAQGLPSEHLTHLARDAAGVLWMAHWGHGISRLVDGRASSLDRSRGLAGDQIWAVHADREGSLWVGSWNGGLNRLRPRVFAVLGEPEGLGGDNTRSLLHARDGSTWVASAGGGVSRIRDGRIETLRERDGLPSNEASALFEDEDGSLWIGTYTAGLARWKDGRLQRFGVAEGLPHVDVRALQRDGAGRLWVGTANGLARLDAEGRRFEPQRGLADQGVMTLRRARGGGLWVGTASEGLLRLDDTGKLKQRWGREQGLCSNSIPTLHEDEDGTGTLWVGCNGEGLSRLTPDGRLRAISPADGLWDGVTLSLQADRRGQFWVSTNRGFYRVARAELQAFADGRATRVHSVGYGPGDALRSTTFAGSVQPAGAVDGKGRIWLPSLRGVVIVDPERLPDSGQPPAVRVDEAAIAGQWQAVGNAPLQLPAGSSPLTLRYAADTMLNAERVRFRFQMQGLSDAWIDAGKGREARFPALPHGDYRFRVAASLDGQRWSESAPLALRVPPLLHQHPAFRALLLLVMLGLGYGAYRLRTRQLRRREEELRRLVDERTEALRRANEELEQLSFTDALTGLANRRRFDELLQTEWRRCDRQQLPLALLVIDVDHFKAYNDALGHEAGDQALQAVAQLIQAHSSRAGELAARYGGEEFVLLLPGLDLAAARAQGQRLVQACEAAALPHPAAPTAAVLTLSVGAAACQPAEGGSSATLFAVADAALYRAKEQGRNRVS